ncbi:MAG: transposase [SAR324 cluster bacterium]|nr:transposase [SAR324 cluster bacterium]
MNKRIERRSYSLEFKLEAVRLTNQSNHPKPQIAKELGISRAVLYS